MSDKDAPGPSEVTDTVWGAEAIGRELGDPPLSVQQVYYLHRSGALKGAVRKLGHRTMIGSRRKLRELALTPEA
jgi:hypothetical protein